MVSAGPYANLHLTPGRQPRQHRSAQFFTGRMPFLPPNQQCQSTEAAFSIKVQIRIIYSHTDSAFSALTLFRKGIWPVKTEWWRAGMVICLELGADLHVAQLMPLPLTVSCFNGLLNMHVCVRPAWR